MNLKILNFRISLFKSEPHVHSLKPNFEHLELGVFGEPNPSLVPRANIDQKGWGDFRHWGLIGYHDKIDIHRKNISSQLLKTKY